MIEILQGYPDEVLAVSGAGRITADECRKVLAPEAEARIARHGSVRTLMVLGPRFQTFASSAVWSDVLSGLSSWSRFGRVALVTDVEWVRASARLFMPFFHRPLRIFGTADMKIANAWIRGADVDDEPRPAPASRHPKKALGHR
jgi:hypothetical protein